MNIFKPLQVLAAAALITSAAHPAFAQRAPVDRDARRAERRQRIENMTPEQRQQFFQNRGGGRGQRGQGQAQGQNQQQMMQNMTPEQLAQWQQRQAERTAQREAAKWNWVRQTLIASGTTEAATQNAVIAFMQAQEKAREPLRQQARALAETLVNAATPDDKRVADLAAFQSAVEADTARYKTELAALDTTVKFSTQPRLETLLTLLGVVGAEAPALGGVGAIFPQSPMAGGGGGRGRGAQGGAPNAAGEQ